MSPALQVGSLPLASLGAKLQRIQRISLSSRVSTLSVWVLSNFSHVRLFVTLWTVACQAPLSVGFSRQEYWSGLPCPLQEVFGTQGLNSCLWHPQHWLASSLLLVPPGKPLKDSSFPHWESRVLCHSGEFWQNEVTNSMHMSLSTLCDILKDNEAAILHSMGLQRVRHNLATKQQHNTLLIMGATINDSYYEYLESEPNL